MKFILFLSSALFTTTYASALRRSKSHFEAEERKLDAAPAAEGDVKEENFLMEFTFTDETFSTSGINCVDPYNTENVIPFWTFAKGSAEMAAAEYLQEHGDVNDDVSPMLWSLSFTEIHDGSDSAGQGRQLAGGEKDDNRALYFFPGGPYSYGRKINKVCIGCGPSDDRDKRRQRKLGDSNAYDETGLNHQVAKSLKLLLKNQCSLGNLEDVRFNVVAEEEV